LYKGYGVVNAYRFIQEVSIFEWLSVPQSPALFSAIAGSKLRISGSIHPQYSIDQK